MKMKLKWCKICLTLLFSSCSIYKEEYSEVLYEPATVITAAYSPSRHNLTLMPVYNITYSKMDLVLVPSVVPEKFSVVFQCQHAQFVVEDELVYREMALLVGKEVSVAYREVYHVVYRKNDKRELVVVERTLTDYDFLNAKPMGEIPEGSL